MSQDTLPTDSVDSTQTTRSSSTHDRPQTPSYDDPHVERFIATSDGPGVILGDFFFLHNSIPQSVADNFYEMLIGSDDDWAVGATAPSDQNPGGRLIIRHETFDSHDAIFVNSVTPDDLPAFVDPTPDSDIVFNVYQGTPTDILTLSEGISLTTAVPAAVAHANRLHTGRRPHFTTRARSAINSLRALIDPLSR